MYPAVFLRRLFLYASVLLLTQCSKCKDDPQPKDPVSQLPPATQEGKNTFGCLVNGQAWTPKGNDGTPNFDVLYDPTAFGGSLDVRAYRRIGNLFQAIFVGGGHIDHVGIYSLQLPGEQGAGFLDPNRPQSCGFMNTDAYLSYRRGVLTITRLDLQARVIAGTFSFTLARPGCDTLRVTEGRFDGRL